MRPGFLEAEEILDDVDVGRLNAEHSGNAMVIAAIIDMERIINDAPFRNRLCTSL